METLHRFTDVMIDIETFDVKDTAVIVSIGAVAFDVRGAHASQNNATFYSGLICPDSQLPGRTVSGNTLLFWFRQSQQARALFDGNAKHTLPTALRQLASFIRMNATLDAKIWGNGVDFDNAILKSAYAHCEQTLPWTYQQNACYRTVMGLGLVEKEKLPQRIGTFHNALDDAMTQAVRLQAVAKCLVP